MPIALELKNISFSYQAGSPVLEDVSLQLQTDEILGIIGPNGGGKTTLLNLLIGQLRPTAGEYLIAQQPVNYRNFPYHYFGYVPQKKELNTLFPLTVRELLNIHRNANSPLDRLIKQYQIEPFMQQCLGQLSGGQLQRVLIVRSLLNSPAILLLDEPSTGLDSQGIDELENLLRTIKKSRNLATIIVDHNIKQVLKVSDRILCINKQHHWHDSSDKLSAHVLNSVYHCEFEHEQIHEKLETAANGHHHCHQHTPQEAQSLDAQDSKEKKS
jgi:zinc transport system ATP-binding protein